MDEPVKSIGQIRTEPAPNSPSAGTFYIFAIGIDRYQHVNPLNNAVGDAGKVVTLLTSNYQFDVSKVTFLKDEAAKRSAIHKEFRRLIDVVTPQDTVLIYFSGHGIEDKDDGYWIPVDGVPDDTATFVSNIEIVNFLKKINSFHTLLISDSCFSGTLFTDPERRAMVRERLETIPSRWAMTSGRVEPVSDGQPGETSPFADSLLLHLGSNTDAVLPVSHLFDAIIEDVGSNNEQTPRCEPLRNVGHRGGEFMFRIKSASLQLQQPVPAVEAPIVPVKPASIESVEVEETTFVKRYLKSTHWLAGAFLFMLTSLIIWFDVTKAPEIINAPVDPERKSPLATDTLNDENKPLPFLSDSVIYLPNIKAGSIHPFRFKVVNPGNVEAAVEIITPACPFIIVNSPLRFFCPARTSKEIEVVWRAERTIAERTCIIEVRYFEGKHADQLIVKAQTIPNGLPPKPAVNAIRISPASQDLGVILNSKTDTFQFTIENTGTQIIEINSIIADRTNVKIPEQTITIFPNESKAVTAYWLSGHVYGRQQCVITVNANGLHQHHTILVTAKIIKEPPTPPICTVRFKTRGISGIKIWFDEYGGEGAAKISSEHALTLDFSLPGEALQRNTTAQFFFNGRQITRTIFIPDTVYTPDIPTNLLNN